MGPLVADRRTTPSSVADAHSGGSGLVNGGAVRAIEVTSYDSDTAVMVLRGEHDLRTSEELNAKLVTLVQANYRVIVDLSVAQFVDSTVLNALLRADKLAAQRGHRLTLQLGGAHHVERVLEVSGLLDCVPWASTREQAVALAGQEASASAGTRWTRGTERRAWIVLPAARG